MRWTPGGRSDNLEDRRGASGGGMKLGLGGTVVLLAHEIGHHVQNLTGIEKAMRNAVQRNPAAGNQLSVAMELQADCYAGVWAYSAARAGIIEAGDLDEGLGAAAAVGDDRLQKMSTGRVNPESFTHGSSADRRAWFRKGFDSGDPRRCDTFRQGR